MVPDACMGYYHFKTCCLSQLDHLIEKWIIEVVHFFLQVFPQALPQVCCFLKLFYDLLHHCMFCFCVCDQVKDGLVVLKSAKFSLEKCMSGCLDLAAQMEVKAAVDNASAPKAKEIKAAA